MSPPYPRRPWLGPELILVHGSLDQLRGKPPTLEYRTAKGGDDQLAAVKAADEVIRGCIDAKLLAEIMLGLRHQKLQKLCVVAPFRKPEDLSGVNPAEFSGNAIGVTFARFTANFLKRHLPDTQVSAPLDIFQTAVGRRTLMSTERRFIQQACFAGAVVPNAHYLIVDDVVTTAGALAQLRSHIICGKGKVVGAMALAYAGGQHRALAFAPRVAQLTRIRNLFGADVDRFWRKTLGHDLACISGLEAQRLINLGENIKACEPNRAPLDALRDRFRTS